MNTGCETGSFFLIFVVVVISLFRYLDEECGFAIFANELFIVTCIEFSSAQRAKRDFSFHQS
jgi:hypothetical protein